MLVSHEATLSGAPRIAVQIAEALEGHGYAVTTLLRWDGPLKPEMAKASSAFLLEPFRRARATVRRFWPTSSIANRIDEAVAYFTLLLVRPRAAYLNTVKSACYIRPSLRLGIPVVLHVHELEPLASTTLARYRLEGSYARVSLAACSEAVAENLAVLTNRPMSEIAIVPSFVDPDRVRASARAHSSPRAVDPATKDLVVGACGSVDRRKGFDLWLEAAAAVFASRPDAPLRFVWVGRQSEEPTALIRSLGIESHVDFSGETDNAPAAMAQFDIFTLPSRSDPFPLVVLEAMSLALPVVAFAIDGVPEQMGETGCLVAAEDTYAFARAILDLVDDPGLRAKIGQAGVRRVDSELTMDRFNDAVVAVLRVASSRAVERSAPS